MNNDFNPLVSIVIPVYNGSNYVSEAIDSALAQTYKNIEVIVVNDGSIDGGKTEEIALSYGDRIRYFRKQNGGVASALNLGIEKMEGEYFSWLSHDDLYLPEKIETQIEILKNLEDKTTLVTGGYKVVNFEGKHLYDVDPTKDYSTNQLETSVFSLLRGAIHGCSILIHRSHFQRVGNFDTSLPTTQDYDLFFRILHEGKLKYQNGLYVLSRSHDEQDSKKLLGDHVNECNQLWIGMLEKLTNDEKCRLDGSLSSFYKNTHDFLKRATAYDKTIAYTYYKFLEEEKKKGLLNKDILKEVCKDEIDLICHYYETINKKSEKQKICFILGDINSSGGLNRVVIQNANMLCNYYDVYLINVFGEEYNGQGFECSQELKIINYPLHRMTSYNDHSFIKYLKVLDIKLVIISYNCDALYLKLYKDMSLYDIKTIAWNHEFYFLPHIKPYLYNCIFSRNDNLKYADVSIWLTTFSANVYSIFQENAVVMPNPLTMKVDENKEIIDATVKDKDIVAIGRFDDDRKGLEQLINTFVYILRRLPNTKLYVIGPYNLDLPLPSNKNVTYGELIRKLNISKENIIFLGLCDDNEMRKYFNKSCIHLLTSHHEGFGLVTLETAAYGIPTILFDGSGLEDIITDGKDGFIVPFGDVKSMSHKAIKLLTDNKVLAEMSVNVKRLPEKYEPDKIISRWNDLINATLILNKDELNQYLKKEFFEPVKDTQKFIAQIVKEYDNFSNKLLAMFNSSAVQEIILKQVTDANTEQCILVEQSLLDISNKWRIYKLYYYARYDRYKLKSAVKWRLANKPILYSVSKKIYNILKSIKNKIIKK